MTTATDRQKGCLARITCMGGSGRQGLRWAFCIGVHTPNYTSTAPLCAHVHEHEGVPCLHQLVRTWKKDGERCPREAICGATNQLFNHSLAKHRSRKKSVWGSTDRKQNPPIGNTVLRVELDCSEASSSWLTSPGKKWNRTACRPSRNRGTEGEARRGHPQADGELRRCRPQRLAKRQEEQPSEHGQRARKTQNNH